MTVPANIAAEVQLEQATAVLSIGNFHGWPIPAGYEEAFEFYAAAKAAATAREPVLPPAPTTAKGIPAYLTKAAAARAEWRESRDLATQLQTAGAGQIVTVARSVVRDYIDRLAAEFDDTATTFAQLLKTAPRTITGQQSADELTEHNELIRTAGMMTRAVVDRGRLAILTGEHQTLGRQGAVWLVLDPNSTASTDALLAAVQRFGTALPASVDDWEALQTVGIRIAAFNEASARIELHNQVMYYRGRHDPSQGMHHSRYADWVTQYRTKATAA
jgi:hypothetical protein